MSARLARRMGLGAVVATAALAIAPWRAIGDSKADEAPCAALPPGHPAVACPGGDAADDDLQGVLPPAHPPLHGRLPPGHPPIGPSPQALPPGHPPVGGGEASDGIVQPPLLRSLDAKDIVPVVDA